jgi:phospholipid/cholesterol/gamma-HCH transport system substrate-binding protein
MISRRVKIQLVIFALIAAIGVTYTGARYAGLDRLFGAGGYLVSVRLADSGGIFPNAEVTYRGVAVGQVTALRLNPDGVTADLRIEDTAPPIPADTAAVVSDRSAIGEQTVDLRPAHTGGPYLAEGAVIPVERTTLPPTPSDVLTDLDRLAASVPADSLRTVVTELGTGFVGTGPSLRQLIDGAGGFSQTATAHLPQTVDLLDSAQTVLNTQREQSTDVLELSRGLRQIAAQLKSSDPDLRRIVDDAPGLADQVQWLLDHAGQPLSDVVRNSLVVARITETRVPALQELLVAFPMVNAVGPTLAPDGRGRLAFIPNFYDPPPCEKGYQGTKQRGADEFGPVKPNYGVHCAEQKGSPTSVRGSQNAPTGGGR